MSDFFPFMMYRPRELPDPYGASDGEQNITGALSVAGAVTAGGTLTSDAAIVRHHVHADVNAADYVVLATDYFVFATDSAGGDNDVVLPDAPTDSRTIVVHNSGAALNITVATAGADTIEGVASVEVGPDGTVLLTYDASATDWTSH